MTTRDEILLRVREIVAAQMSFDVEGCDSFDADLGIAGHDVDEILASVHREFGTDFSTLSEFGHYYFYPEVSALDWSSQLVIFLMVFGLFFFVVSRSHRTSIGWLVLCSLVLLVIAWHLFEKQRSRQYAADKLRFTVDDIVEAVMRGRWEAPEDIWLQIESLGRKKGS